MSFTPFFSIVIPLYNKEKFIKNTINSILNQSYHNFEIIVVNDGCTDNSIAIVRGINNDKISIINQKNKGLSAARNIGVKNAKHKYVAFLDADDLWCEDYLSTIAKLISFYITTKVFTTKSIVLKPGQHAKLSATPFNSKRIQFISNYFKYRKNIFSNSSIVINKEVFIEIGDYNETFNYGEEEDFFIRCFSKYQLVHYNVGKVYYLKGIDNQLTSPNNKTNRVIPNYSKYLTKENSKILKPYIDFIYFKLVVLYKMERNKQLVKQYKDKIEISNLNLIQKIKYFLPTTIFYYSKSIYSKLSKMFTHS